MVHVFVLSAYQTSAEEFFDRLRGEGADLVLDVRLKNTNQLAGFTKKRDLDYFVRTIVGARYVHDPLFAPDPQLLGSYLHKAIDFGRYAREYGRLLESRGAIMAVSGNMKPTDMAI